MLRCFLVALVLCLSGFAASANNQTSLRQFHASISTPTAELIGELRTRMPGDVTVLPTSEGAVLSYAARGIHPALSEFLNAAFDEFDQEDLAVGRAVTLTMTLTASDSGSDLALMVMGHFKPNALAMPDGARVLLDGLSPETCTGQLILSHPARRKDAASLYRETLEQAGFAFPDASPRETSFFIGYGPDCDVALYLQNDPAGSLIVIRYLEE